MLVYQRVSGKKMKSFQANVVNWSWLIMNHPSNHLGISLHHLKSGYAQSTHNNQNPVGWLLPHFSFSRSMLHPAGPCSHADVSKWFVPSTRYVCTIITPGWWFQPVVYLPLWKIMEFVTVGMIFHSQHMENSHLSKPPTSHFYVFHGYIHHGFAHQGEVSTPFYLL